MNKIIALAIGLGLVLGTVSFAQDKEEKKAVRDEQRREREKLVAAGIDPDLEGKYERTMRKLGVDPAMLSREAGRA